MTATKDSQLPAIFRGFASGKLVATDARGDPASEARAGRLLACRRPMADLPDGAMAPSRGSLAAGDRDRGARVG
jgi:hypothetical protein